MSTMFFYQIHADLYITFNHATVMQQLSNTFIMESPSIMYCKPVALQQGVVLKTLTLRAFLCVCVSLEGENWLSSATEETQVPQRPGSGSRRPGDRVPQDAGPGTAEHDRRTDQSESAPLVYRTGHHI